MNKFQTHTEAQPPYLLLTQSDGSTQIHSLDSKGNLFAGTGPNCRISLEGSDVNEIHCMFWIDDQNKLMLQDWNTGGKTLVNGEPIDIVELHSGDEIQVAGNHLLVVLEPCHQPQQKPVEFQEPTNDAQEPDLLMTEADEKPAAATCLIDEPETPVIDFDHGFDGDIDVGADFAEFAEPESSFECDATELLQLEVEQLRYELADRDARLNLLNEKLAVAKRDNADRVENEETLRLVDRLEELLDELQTADDRTRTLEDLLRVSDEATQAERDERLQLENWVSEIESRVSQRESEYDAERERMERKILQVNEHHQQTQLQLKKALLSNGDPDGCLQASIDKYAQRVESLEQKLIALREENEKYRQAESDGLSRAALVQQLRDAKQKLLDLEVQSSRERADMSRRHAELEEMKAGLEQKLDAAQTVDRSDSKIQAMRQHLRDIHEEEKLARETKQQNSLGSRISRLLGRVG